MTRRYVPEDDHYPNCNGVCIQCAYEWDDKECPMSGSKDSQVETTEKQR